LEGVIGIKLDLSTQLETESAHASVKYHTLDLPSHNHRGSCSSH